LVDPDEEDNNPKLLEKQRKADEEKRKAEERRRKQQEAREQLAKEEAEFKSKGSQAATKVTLAERARDREAERARLEAERERREREQANVVVLDLDAPIPENTNRSVEIVVAARSVDAALEQFDRHASTASTADTASPAPALSEDRNPEKRLKAAFAAYEEKNLQRLRDENPSLRLQQVKNMLWEDWQKAPENPLVQQRNAEQAARLNEKRAHKDGK
jgi:hypothetical protein